MTIRVLLCDDHAILRDGLRNLLDAEEDIEVVGEAQNGREALNEVQETRPDVVLMDINMPELGGVETVEVLSERFPELHILMLTMFDHDEYLFRTIRAGAKGYLLKDSPVDTVIDAIRKVMSGCSVLSADLASKLLATYREKHNDAIQAERLSPREQEVLTALVQGLSNREIAETLFITETTVKLHISNIYRKLGVKSRSQAIMRAVKDGLVTIQ